MKKNNLAAISGALIVMAAIGTAAFYYLNQTKTLQADSTAETTVSENAATSEAQQKMPQGKPLASLIVPKHIYAQVGDFKVTGETLLGLAKSIPPQVQENATPQVIEAMSNQLINDHLIEKKAKELKFDTNPAVTEQLTKLKSRLISEAYIRSLVEKDITEDKVRKKFDEFVFNLERKPQVRARHILVDSEDEAKALIKELEKGADFAELAKKSSTGPSGPRGGELGYFTKDMMVPEFADAAFNLEKNQISKTPIKTQFGWHVIKVEDKRLQPKPEFDQVKGQIQSQLADELIRTKISELREATEIKTDFPKVETN